MRIDLNNISLNGVEREDKTRKAGSKAPSAPSVEDKTSLSVGYAERLLARSPGHGRAQPSGRTRSMRCASRSRTVITR